ncbi:alpha-ketoglutarate dehydrogenase component 4 isoform X1 [Episyrphus balteatus]|uniref:alpha-ketoglutarate dehydrogenase component 4 isoform X1 n=1 Tax=Episyrphus balteatus TaxID=286459 RepID=UPI002486A5C1|nr:alpha-ketoglutarate dehydrogenase component 4 isoform X1 [Episyrphus balteatus]
MVFQSLVNSTARRIPLIKFRKGGLGLPGQKGPGSPAAAGSSASSTNLTKPSGAQSRGPTIEDWELPPRYWRKPLSAAEMDYINRGGPA